MLISATNTCHENVQINSKFVKLPISLALSDKVYECQEISHACWVSHDIGEHISALFSNVSMLKIDVVTCRPFLCNHFSHILTSHLRLSTSNITYYDKKIIYSNILYKIMTSTSAQEFRGLPVWKNKTKQTFYL